jgi:hypothetical protein
LDRTKYDIDKMENDFNPFLDMNPFSHTEQLNNMMAVGPGVGHGPLQQPLMVSRCGHDGDTDRRLSIPNNRLRSYTLLVNFPQAK